MHHKKPVPVLGGENKPRRMCPVCATVSYSRNGIHPQCAQIQADAPRVERLKAVHKSKMGKEKVGNPAALTAWHKRCPKCQTELHLRKLVCNCGYRFS